MILWWSFFGGTDVLSGSYYLGIKSGLDEVVMDIYKFNQSGNEEITFTVSDGVVSEPSQLSGTNSYLN